ncbi:MAG: hypothetical protein US96_C0016G0008 [Candidatus Woesebacteria bacterium GW2011_GWB1_38_5b]|uniref:Uncharacterized protein n=1 Tax=Candidatus Woesebacteria bacterium GW2011_GWB1_38_5b TaxID=1618569 RepID=A0A0G0MNC4_9BACT|nr:MAG: hypothetical protein US96_C0016G0008 [Candidatus Woesebacteria bacterium GW2011_GWB1_38_5b]KKQ76864.1 MAG: hypothetical protein UT00_C0029G0002 [Parcubacteria group bacterium GW2011_GWA1_38_7]
MQHTLGAVLLPSKPLEISIDELIKKLAAGEKVDTGHNELPNRLILNKLAHMAIAASGFEPTEEVQACIMYMRAVEGASVREIIVPAHLPKGVSYDQWRANFLALWKDNYQILGPNLIEWEVCTTQNLP